MISTPSTPPLSNDVVQVVSSSVTIVGSLVMMLRLSPRLVLVFAVTIPWPFFWPPI